MQTASTLAFQRSFFLMDLWLAALLKHGFSPPEQARTLLYHHLKAVGSNPGSGGPKTRQHFLDESFQSLSAAAVPVFPDGC